MDSPTDLYDDAAHQIRMYTSALRTPDLPGHGRAPPVSRTPDFHLMQHLLQSGGATQRPGGQLHPNAQPHNNPTPIGRRYFENKREGAEKEERGPDAPDEGGDAGGVAGMEGCLPGLRKRRGGAALVAEWSRDALRSKRLKQRGNAEETEEEEEEEEEGRGRARGKVGEKRRREREELKEQLEEARGRLQALQEKVWRAFGEKHGTPVDDEEEEEEEEEKKQQGRRCREEKGGGGADRPQMTGEEEEEDIVEGLFEEEDEEEEGLGRREADLPLSLLPALPFGGGRWRGDREADAGGKMGGKRGGGGGGGGAGGGAGLLEGVLETAGVWLGCGGLVRGEWLEGGGADGGEAELLVAAVGEEEAGGGQKFAQALKVELGSAVARVIDRVLRLYAEHEGEDGGRGRRGGGRAGGRPGSWMGALLQERGGGMGGEEEEEEEEEEGDPHERPRGARQQLMKTNTPGRWPHGDPRPRQSHDGNNAKHKPGALLGGGPPSYPPHSAAHLHPQHHPNAAPHHQAMQRAPSLLAPPSQAPPPPPPPQLSLPLLHYSMQQLFSRALPHLPPPSHKDYLTSDPFLDAFPGHHPGFPPLPLMGHLEPSMGPRHHPHPHHPHPHHGGPRGRDRGMRGGGGGELGGGGGMDCGDMYLPLGGISFPLRREGLSPCHLKKAKLMFFYARYPSSNTLKTYFPDVKFNRCVTSQLIKWFSNFREFFYIQMERFARQAVRDALTRDGTAHLGGESHLRMSRDTELYRILNMHYNKSNVYQVPEKFIEVAEVALREFYSAIHNGRDTDPCWKKGIYKIICKLDSPVPDAFRLPGCPVG
ncbi:unnamed protein product [Gadus morhua 'NCC']